MLLDGEAAAEKRLIACCVGDSLRKASLVESLERALPKQLHPAAIYYLDAFPLNPNGKIDSAALIEQVGGLEHSRAAHECLESLIG